jgi:ssDNA-binding Zn-finger/Zn-ribbon topoisomerase 1
MTAKQGKQGPFLRCEKDDCLIVDLKALIAAKGAKCPDCRGWMVRRKTPKTAFLSCAKYPDCKGRTWLEQKKSASRRKPAA